MCVTIFRFREQNTTQSKIEIENMKESKKRCKRENSYLKKLFTTFLYVVCKVEKEQEKK